MWYFIYSLKQSIFQVLHLEHISEMHSQILYFKIRGYLATLKCERTERVVSATITFRCKQHIFHLRSWYQTAAYNQSLALPNKGEFDVSRLLYSAQQFNFIITGVNGIFSFFLQFSVDWWFCVIFSGLYYRVCFHDSLVSTAIVGECGRASFRPWSWTEVVCGGTRVKSGFNLWWKNTQLKFER